MFRNYLLIAYKVLLRRRFFTFVNIFAIALTLAVLTVVIALVQNYIHPAGAQRKSDHYLAVENAMIRTADGSSEWTSPLGFRMIEKHFLPLEEPDLIGFFSTASPGTVFVEGRKLTPKVAMTDANYWKILEFEFLEGRGLSAGEVDQGSFVAVINQRMSEEIFSGEDPVGRSLTANGQLFEVVGVVQNVSALNRHAFAEIWVPYTTAASSSFRQEWMGRFKVLLWSEDKATLPRVQEEVWNSFENFVHDDPDQFQIAAAPANTRLQSLSRQFLGRRFTRDSKAGLFLAFLGFGMVAFMLLPSINLINLNVSRILERASEIGIRKAFGASAGDLVQQFLVENMVLSLLGGGLGFLLGTGFLQLVEDSGMIPYARFQVDFQIFFLAFGATVVFGLVSGVYPAYRMAKFTAIKALRGG